MNLKIVFVAAALFVCVLGSTLEESQDVVEQEIMPLFNAVNDVRFLVFTRFNPTIGQVLRFRDLESLSLTNFDVSRPTRVLVHGFQSDATADVNVLLTAAYLRNYDVNIIVVDWRANTINYITARNRVNQVGAVVAEFLDMANMNNEMDFSRVTLIGHSLGAHAAGMAAKNVRRGRINSIIGLDPAGPLFSLNTPATRLAVTDADYVECIQTDNRNFGIGAPLGHVDFFPNGGSNQPGCLTSICDHNRAVDFFVESLNSQRLWGRQCVDIDDVQNFSCSGVGANMGGEPSNAARNLRGLFRFNTNNNAPFGQGQF
ncbi:unnamed protein product [Diamesa serratosioi]